MQYMLVTFFVSNFETSSVVRAEQPENILLMFVTFSVLRFSIPSITVRYLHVANHALQFVGRASANEASKTTFMMFSLFPNHSGKKVFSFRAYAPAGLLASCLNVSVNLALSYTTYDSAV